jgi:hypothetical protein
MFLLCFPRESNAQVTVYERIFPQSRTALQEVLKHMQASMAGHLPVLDGFAVPSDYPLERYRRAYYQTTVQATSTAWGGSLVRVSAKVTAWYADPIASRSGYQLLTSNGRIETDLLDELSEQLATIAPTSQDTKKIGPASEKPGPVPTTNAAATQLPGSSITSSSYLAQSLATREQPAWRAPTNPDQNTLQGELNELHGILKNQVHPTNLAAVKKSNTAVVAAPSLEAKPLFLASAHDEFEILDFNRDWVHVRISGPSRGWVWHDDLEMPEDISDAETAAVRAVDASMFRITREETAPFPGDWEPLRGKNVKIISVQRAGGASKGNTPQMKLEFAKFLFERNYLELVRKAHELAGVVLIFDSSDGGMIAAPELTLEEWKAGTLSDEALWHHCFLDPPETFTTSGTSSIQ